VINRIGVSRRRTVLPRRALDLHDHQPAAGFRRQLEHLLGAATDVVDRDGAGPKRGAGHLGRERVGGERKVSPAGQALDGREQLRRFLPRRHRRAAPRRHRAHVEHLEARVGECQPVLDRPVRGAAASPLEHRVVGDVDDPDAQGRLELERPVPEPP
jgi:hypothetical protein